MHAAITCPSLPDPASGLVSYSSDLDSDTDVTYNYGTVATLTCGVGYGLIGDTTRRCDGDGVSPNGDWSGSSSTSICVGELS